MPWLTSETFWFLLGGVLFLGVVNTVGIVVIYRLVHGSGAPVVNGRLDRFQGELEVSRQERERIRQDLAALKRDIGREFAKLEGDVSDWLRDANEIVGRMKNKVGLMEMRLSHALPHLEELRTAARQKREDDTIERVRLQMQEEEEGKKR